MAQTGEYAGLSDPTVRSTFLHFPFPVALH
jgi:hypothetical protein